MTNNRGRGGRHIKRGGGGIGINRAGRSDKAKEIMRERENGGLWPSYTLLLS